MNTTITNPTAESEYTPVLVASRAPAALSAVWQRADICGTHKWGDTFDQGKLEQVCNRIIV